MSKLLLEKKGKVSAGMNALLNFTAARVEGGKLKIFDDHIEFILLWFRKKLDVSDIDFVEIRARYAFWFAHHGKTWKFLSFYCSGDKNREEIIKTLKALRIKIKEEAKPKRKLSPYK